MKSFLFLLTLIILLVSCQQMDMEFSCDPAINNFVKENQEELSVLTLDGFLNYDFSLQKAIFNSWDPWKKRDIWIEKLEQIAVRETFTTEEVEYIQQVIEHLDSDYFVAGNLEKGKEIRTQFADQWIDEVKTNLGWTNKFIAFLVYRLYIDEDQFENEISKLKLLKESVNTNSEGSCNCAQSSDYCGDTDCIATGCTATSGCGWLWSMECNGLCYL